MHYNIIILSKQNITYDSTYVIDSKVKLLDDCHLLHNEETISFDYLLITDITLAEGYKEVGVLTENKLPITNFEAQTSVENIYYCKDNDIEEILANL